jgi:CRP-like cAMP-binding protein
MNLESLRRDSELLRSLDEAQVAFLESVSEETNVVAGETLFEEGGQADRFYVVSVGKVALEMTSPGRAPMVIQTLGPGELVGVSWLFPPHRWSWRARAVVDTKLARFDAAEVRRRCEEDAGLRSALLAVVAEEVVGRLHRARIQLLDLYRSGS